MSQIQQAPIQIEWTPSSTKILLDIDIKMFSFIYVKEYMFLQSLPEAMRLQIWNTAWREWIESWRGRIILACAFLPAGVATVIGFMFASQFALHWFFESLIVFPISFVSTGLCCFLIRLVRPRLLRAGLRRLLKERGYQI